MINPQSISEKLLYSTTILKTTNGLGTGFFFNFIFDEKKSVPVIITNKHVVNNNPKEKVNLFFHTKSNGLPGLENIEIPLEMNWFFHKCYDICFCFINPLIEQIKKEQQKEIFYIPISEDIILDYLKLEELNAIEDVIMIGYPIGLWDEKNNFPLFRKGITATHPSVDFNNQKIGVIDMACFPGSSGSPIFVLNESNYYNKTNNTTYIRKRVIFLGILYAGPTYDSKGKLIIENIPTKNKTVLPITEIFTNLGYYIKANEILAFKPEIAGLIH